MVVLESNGKWLAVWPGDMLLEQLASKASGKNPTILVGPHHGAPADCRKKPDSARWMNSLLPRRSFISVGTRNSHSHPSPGYIELLAQTGCRVVCSELTRLCDPERALNKRSIFPAAGMLGLRAPRSKLSVACRGPWRVFFKNGGLHPDGYDAEHLLRVAKLRRPQCLRGCGWRPGKSLPTFGP
jgi:hypothetical protein